MFVAIAVKGCLCICASAPVFNPMIFGRMASLIPCTFLILSPTRRHAPPVSSHVAKQVALQAVACPFCLHLCSARSWSYRESVSKTDKNSPRTQGCFCSCIVESVGDSLVLDEADLLASAQVHSAPCPCERWTPVHSPNIHFSTKNASGLGRNCPCCWLEARFNPNCRVMTSGLSSMTASKHSQLFALEELSHSRSLLSVSNLEDKNAKISESAWPDFVSCFSSRGLAEDDEP